jgi:hypothetical protein
VNVEAATSCKGRIDLGLSDSNEAVIEVGGGRLNIVSTINGKLERIVSRSTQLQNLPETRLRLKGPISDKKLHA